MRVLLIGGSGFVGSHLVDELLERGASVIVYDRVQERFRPPRPEVTFVQGEFGKRDALEAVIAKGVDGVVHLASSTVPKTSNDDPIFDVQANLVNSLALFDACVKHKVQKVVFASSGGTVYGIPRYLPVTEEHPTHPICSYGVVKLAIENYLYVYHQLFGLQYVVLRMSNPYGPRQDPNSIQGAIPVFAARMLQEKYLTIWGDGEIVRDFVHVKDVVKLFYCALTQGASGVFNAGSGVGVSVNKLLALMASRLHVEPKIVREPPRKFDVPAIVLNNEKAKKAFSWEPRIPLEHGVWEVGNWLCTDVLGSSLLTDPKQLVTRQGGKWCDTPTTRENLTRPTQ
jgi:UDP-glucose 4-epimerase